MQTYTCTLANVQSDFTNVADGDGHAAGGAGCDGQRHRRRGCDQPCIDIRKNAEEQTAAGRERGTATFTIRVENTGDVALTNVVVTDPLAPDCDKTFASLAVAAVQTLHLLAGRS